MTGRVIVVPGLLVRRYAEEPVERLRQVGDDADLRSGLIWRNVPLGIGGEGRALGAEMAAVDEPVDVLVRLSAGTPAADCGGIPRLAPNGAHSWPTDDPNGSLQLLDNLVGVRR